MSLRLTTPKQHDFQDPTLELDEKRLRQWLTDLPVLNTSESLRMVLRALEPLNEQRLEPGKRLRLLAVYRATASRLYDTAEPVQLRQQPIPRQQRQETVDDVERLCLAVANGFKIAIKDLFAAGGQRNDPAQFALALGGAVQQLAAALVHSYRFYRPEPPSVFLELNQLYRLAHECGLHDQPYADEEGGLPVSLATIYHAISMLALVDPFAAEEGRAEQCYRTLLQHAPKVRMVPGNSWQGVPEGLYFIDLNNDSRPRHCIFLQAPVAADDPLIMDARAALKSMHADLRALPADRRRQRPEAMLLASLLPEVTPREKRRSERKADERWLEVVIGLESICEWLLGHARGQQAGGLRLQVKDVSEQGYRLAWQESAASMLQVGDLVCVVADNRQADQQAQLLMVRWVRDGRGQGTELGVEMFDGVPEPVRILVPDETQESMYQALFLSASGPQASVPRLVTPAAIYGEQRSLKMSIGEREMPICCAELTEQAAGFDCFEFEFEG